MGDSDITKGGIGKIYALMREELRKQKQVGDTMEWNSMISFCPVEITAR